MQSETPLDRAKALIEAGKLAEGRAAIAGLDPEQPEVAYLAGLLHYRAREYPAAIQALTKAVRAPESSVTYKEAVQMLGLSCYLSGRLKDAIPWLEKALQSGVRVGPDVFYMLGNSYIQAVEPDKAPALLVPQGDHRVHPEGAAGGNISGDRGNSYQENHGHGNGQRVRYADPEQERLRVLRGPQRQGDSGRNPCQREIKRLAHYQPHNVVAARAQRHAHANLSRAATHRVGHQAIETETGEQ
jgi:tetratricopeptide (TPR) repeat protein